MNWTKHKFNDDIAMDVIRLITNSGRFVGKVVLDEAGTWVWIGDLKTKSAAQVNIHSVRKHKGFFWDFYYTLKISAMIIYVIVRSK